MDDQQILDRIHQLMQEEHGLREVLEHAPAGDAEHLEAPKHLERLEVEVDRLWDLLRQRRARRDAGADPDGAQVRPAAEVEGYLE